MEIFNYIKMSKLVLIICNSLYQSEVSFYSFYSFEIYEYIDMYKFIFFC